MAQYCNPATRWQCTAIKELRQTNYKAKLFTSLVCYSCEWNEICNIIVKETPSGVHINCKLSLPQIERSDSTAHGVVLVSSE